MTNETAQALNELSRRIFETEQKLDNYFKMLHEQNAAKLETLATAADDQMALRGMDMYSLFEEIAGTYQKKGTRCRFEVDGEMQLFKLTCEDQTSEGTYIVENWTPTAAPAIWTKVNA